MACMDKTYVNKEQYILARQFWMDTREKQLEELGALQWLYPFGAFKNHDDDYTNDLPSDELLATNKDIIEYFPYETTETVLWNTGTIFDIWLIKNCKLDFIQDRLKTQYGENFFAFKYVDEMDTSKGKYLLRIEEKENTLYFFKENGGEMISTIDKLVFFGSTYILELIDVAFKSINGIGYKKDRVDLTVTFVLFGLVIQCKNGLFYYLGDEIEPIEDIGWIRKGDFDPIKIKHSYDINDVDDYEDEEIFISKDKECFGVMDFKDYSKDRIGRYVHMLPDYLSDLINFKKNDSAETN
jgi:hypothetical protein